MGNTVSMAMRRRRDGKRRARRGHGDAQPAHERRDHATRPDDDDLEARLDAVSSRFVKPPTPEELRAAFGRKQEEERPTARAQDFASSYPADSLFSPTIDDPIVEPTEAEDRSRSKGDYYYDPDDAWAVLGVAPGASWHEITAAHRRLAMVHHPDRLLDSSQEDRERSEAVMREINVAYSVLRRLTGH